MTTWLIKAKNDSADSPPPCDFSARFKSTSDNAQIGCIWAAMASEFSERFSIDPACEGIILRVIIIVVFSLEICWNFKIILFFANIYQ
jgi:hypothetical protein